MKIIFFKTAALFAAFSTPLASGCARNEDKPGNGIQAVKPLDINVKKAIDEKRKIVEQKERDFAKELGGLASSSLPNVLLDLYMVSDSENDILKARDIAFKLVKRSDEFIELTRNDYLIKKPDEEQLEAFHRVISMTQKGTLYTWTFSTMEAKEITEKFKTYLNKNEPELKGEELKKRVDHTLECFTVYQEDLRNVHKLRDDLYKLMKSFNDDAKKIDQPSYNPVWGLSLEKIQDIRIFVH
ncbi:MAG: hypothetical protein A3I68_01560 [Candidatus Melainabacteria bacterium RIFCSPLOWO2_02_FULL_35_15]|nr:MAG: hypothetical protein A3F80_04870 [Candidatus Melainabacteria bacterium RIFCSPLOWO2_12_FULL_35_11]OGI12998.1 MAG: hypothetical protein A3I68_01560 [Candidatus Melainabacteria bacterium RIFCSPLOWO2_02_FULL_35_15]